MGFLECVGGSGKVPLPPPPCLKDGLVQQGLLSDNTPTKDFFRIVCVKYDGKMYERVVSAKRYVKLKSLCTASNDVIKVLEF